MACAGCERRKAILMRGANARCLVPQHTGQAAYAPGVAANEALALTVLIVFKIMGASWPVSIVAGAVVWYFGNHRVHWPSSGLSILTKIDGTPLIGGGGAPGGTTP